MSFQVPLLGASADHVDPAADEASQLTPTLSFQRLKTEQPLSDEDLYHKIRKESANQHAFQILEALLVFNKHVLKCNFYQPTSMLYRISSQSSTDFLQRSPFRSDWILPSCQRSNTPRSHSVCSLLSEPTSEVSTSDSGMSLEVVSESSDLEERSMLILLKNGCKLMFRNYNSNVRTLFDENYALAATQNLSM